MLPAIPYLPGNSPPPEIPLARYLPPLPGGIAADWLVEHLPRGSFILDPFGAAPHLAVEAARAGYPLIVAANNPILHLLLEISAHPPTTAQAQATLAALASAPVRQERIEPLIRSLYETTCPRCNLAAEAEAFLWLRHASAPHARLLRCPHCGAAGEFPITGEDLERAARHAAGGLHHARALERVAPLDDPLRAAATEALAVYPPRAVYGLMTLVNKLDGLLIPEDQRLLLRALLLAAFDAGNTLWPRPTERERPRQLTVPPQYRENNLWLAMEQAAAQWVALESGAAPLPVTHWPELPPPEGGICIFEGRIKELSEALAAHEIGAVVSALPRPNQAFWALSALWAGWLWGHQAVHGLRGVLQRQRFDWRWHTSALQAAFKSLAESLPAVTPYFCLIGEAEPGFISAAMLAAAQAGLEPGGVALRERSALAQIVWQQPASPRAATGAAARADSDLALGQALQEALRSRAEPATYLWMHTTGLAALLADPACASPLTTSDPFGELQNALKTALEGQPLFVRYGGSDKNWQSGLWWLAFPPPGALTSLSDQVERAVVRALLTQPAWSAAALDAQVCRQFPGLLTPEAELIRVCLDSYGEQQPTSGLWQLREAESPAQRRSDLVEMEGVISRLGEKLGYRVEKEGADPLAILWYEGSDALYALYLSASALLDKYIAAPSPAAERRVLAIPGGRANLLAYKLEHNPALAERTAGSWYFVKYRLLRRLCEEPGLARENFETTLALDPLTYADQQLRML